MVHLFKDLIQIYHLHETLLSFCNAVVVKWITTIPVAARSKAWVCDSSLAEIAGSNPAGGQECLVSVVCQVEVSATG
jgi:hypothetical protein